MVSHAIWPLGSEALRDSVSTLTRSAEAAARCLLQQAGLQNRSYTKIVYSCLIHAALPVAEQPCSLRIDSRQEWLPGSGKVQPLLPASLASC